MRGVVRQGEQHRHRDACDRNRNHFDAPPRREDHRRDGAVEQQEVGRREERTERRRWTRCLWRCQRAELMPLWQGRRRRNAQRLACAHRRTSRM